MNTRLKHHSAILAVLAGLICHAHAAETQRSIETVMNEVMKGSNSLHRKVSLGQGSEDDAKKLLDYFKSLPAETPPLGDKASWTEKTSKLVAAVEAVIAKEPNAPSNLQSAGNCKACHNTHKEP